jgi:glycosyltransferase involved in cell wall biosynthesis
MKFPSWALPGAGPEESFLQGLAKKLGLEGRVHWLGWQQDLSKFYQALDLCIFNSDADALGRTPIEAMAYGLPVIASVTYGGLGDVIHHGKNGIFLDKHDVSLLAEYAIKILNSERMRKQIGTAARKYIKENYIPEVVCEIFHSNLIKYNII